MKKKTSSGFTIIELMMTIVIGGILLAIAIPSFTNMSKNNCLTTKANSMVSALQLARSSAITLHADVTAGGLCRMDANNDGIADGACSNTNEFGGGIVVFRDLDGDGLADTLIEDINANGVLDVGEDLNGNGILDAEIIRTATFACAATIDETTDGGSDVTANSTAFIYASNGAALPRGTFNICDDRDSADYSGRRISLSATGRPSTNSTFTCP